MDGIEYAIPNYIRNTFTIFTRLFEAEVTSK